MRIEHSISFSLDSGPKVQMTGPQYDKVPDKTFLSLSNSVCRKNRAASIINIYSAQEKSRVITYTEIVLSEIKPSQAELFLPHNNQQLPK